MKLPLITIYILNHNYGRYLNKSITSALDQTYPNFEILIIDDCSKDSSSKILNDFSKSGKVRVIYNKKKLGLIGSSIKAIRNSKGKYFLRLDADDYLHKDLLNELYKTIAKRKNISLVFFNYNFFYLNIKFINNFK